jgi:hypothetical protein
MARTSNANSVTPNCRVYSRPANSKIIKTIIRNGREWQLHATKGWRSYRLVKG